MSSFIQRPAVRIGTLAVLSHHLRSRFTRRRPDPVELEGIVVTAHPLPPGDLRLREYVTPHRNGVPGWRPGGCSDVADALREVAGACRWSVGFPSGGSPPVFFRGGRATTCRFQW